MYFSISLNPKTTALVGLIGGLLYITNKQKKKIDDLKAQIETLEMLQ